MPFCIQCGHRNPEGARFCSQCGTPLEQAAQADPPAASSVTDSPVQSPPDSPAEPLAEPAAEPAQPEAEGAPEPDPTMVTPAPFPSEPTPVESAPVEPGPVEPAPIEPTAAEAGPVDPWAIAGAGEEASLQEPDRPFEESRAEDVSAEESGPVPGLTWDASPEPTESVTDDAEDSGQLALADPIEPAVSDSSATITFGVANPEPDRSSLEPDDAAAVDALPSGSALLVVQRGPGAGNRFLLDKEVVTAGRHPDSEIFLDDITVSRHHVEFRRNPEGYVVSDVGSLNGTYVNRDRIEESPLHNGDEVQVGKFRLVYFAGDSQPV